MDRRSGAADHHHGQAECGRTWGHGSGDQPEEGNADQRQDQAAAFSNIPERDKREHSDRGSGLTGHRINAGSADANAKRPRDFRQKRMHVIHVGDDHARTDRHQGDDIEL